ncbi:MAG: Gas vesicle synthesis protein GvpO [Herbinix sp.]|jgi:hypothetical protein|nr:Gas vesicle synthesis protein GvpO [Herbinix sp.]MDF2804811.1 Gas vesicle synthesis protein GvpO [Anaerocolumna sp.]
MNISEVVGKVTLFFREVMKQRCRVLSIVPKEKGWKVVCEVDVDTDYTTKRGLGDIVEIYEVELSDTQEILSFTLKETKRKVAIDSES